MFFPWLLNTKEIKIEKDVLVDHYAILSHCWEKNGEVKFNTLQPGDLYHSEKIYGACQTAQALKHDYIWIDSVCMDKSNAVETATNINSMFEYYYNADVCLTYLSDVDATRPRSRRFESYKEPGRKALWFSRGWTLQELIASPNMRFYDRGWKLIGLKEDEKVKKDLQDASGIHQLYLNGDLKFREASIAKRMSWMAGRNTSRIEDIAYSLLGVFGVTMDLHYGEGVKAFLRLQQLLLQGVRDESIFAWTTCPQGLRCYAPPASSASAWKPTSWGLLAPSPDCFRNSLNVFVPSIEHLEQRNYGWAQDAVQFQVPQKSGTDVTNWAGLPRKDVKFALNCRVNDLSKKPPTVVLHLKSRDGINYVRIDCDTLDPTPGAKPSSNRVFKIDQLIRRPLVVGQPPFILSRTGEPSVKNPYEDAPVVGSRLSNTNMALLSEFNNIAGRGS